MRARTYLSKRPIIWQETVGDQFDEADGVTNEMREAGYKTIERVYEVEKASREESPDIQISIAGPLRDPWPSPEKLVAALIKACHEGVFAESYVGMWRAVRDNDSIKLYP